MSSGSSNIDPIELDDLPVPVVDRLNEELRSTIRRRRRGGPEHVRPQIDAVRRSIHHRRRLSTRQRSQQTESTSRPIHLIGQGGHVTVLLRLMSQSPGQREMDMGTTIRMTIDLPDSPPSLINSEIVQGLSATISRSTNTSGLPRAQLRPRLQRSQQPLRTGLGAPTPQTFRPSLPESQYVMQPRNVMARQCRLPRRVRPPIPVSESRPEPTSELGIEPPESVVELLVLQPIYPADPQPQLEPQSSSEPQPQPQPQRSRRPSLHSQPETQEHEPNPQNPSSN